MMSYGVVLSSLHHRLNPIKSDMTIHFFINVEEISTIDHVIILSRLHHGLHIVMSSFRDRPHHVQSIIKVLLRFRHRPHLYNQSHGCPIWFLSHIVPIRIRLDNSVAFFFLCKTDLYDKSRCCPILSLS